VVFGVFIGEEGDGVAGKGSGDTTTVHLQKLSEAFLNMCLRSTCFIDEASFIF
jgi:hypothetical protein